MNNIEQCIKLIAKSSSFIDDDRLSAIVHNLVPCELNEDELDLVSAASGNQMSYEDFLIYIHKRTDKDGR